jgi:hypothetical protein
MAKPKTIAILNIDGCHVTITEEIGGEYYGWDVWARSGEYLGGHTGYHTREGAIGNALHLIEETSVAAETWWSCTVDLDEVTATEESEDRITAVEKAIASVLSTPRHSIPPFWFNGKDDNTSDVDDDLFLYYPHAAEATVGSIVLSSFEKEA